MSQQTDHGFKAFTAGEALSKYRRVKLSSGSGTQVEYADSEDIGIGVTQEGVASGDRVAVKLWSGEGTFQVEAAGAFTVGDELYCADDGKFDDATSGGPSVLIALKTASGSASIIEANPRHANEGGTSLLYANVADSAEVENTVTETAFDKSKTINGAELRAGDVLEVIARAHVVDNNSTDTLTLKLYVGTEEIVTTGAVDVADNDIGFIHAFIQIRTTGGSGTLNAVGTVALGVPGTVTAKPFRKDEATEDISGDVALTVQATWSVAHADNEVELENLIVLRHRQ